MPATMRNAIQALRPTARGGVAAAATLAAGVALAACANPRIPQDASAAYALAYEVGCDSGYAEAFRDGYSLAYQKDEARYESDAEYRSGWDDGYAYCYEDEWRMPYLMPGGPPN